MNYYQFYESRIKLDAVNASVNDYLLLPASVSVPAWMFETADLDKIHLGVGFERMNNAFL